MNFFAEFYMQIEEKYKNDYARQLVKIKNICQDILLLIFPMD